MAKLQATLHSFFQGKSRLVYCHSLEWREIALFAKAAIGDGSTSYSPATDLGTKESLPLSHPRKLSFGVNQLA
jgi:hypothetical protein